jgi:hypothetical protein
MDLTLPPGPGNTTFPVNDPGMPEPYSHGYTLDTDGNWTGEKGKGRKFRKTLCISPDAGSLRCANNFPGLKY